MIRLNELRYGNLIHNKDKKEIRINHISDIVSIGQNNEKYFGIDITPEWLAKMGFEKEIFKYMPEGNDDFRYLAMYYNKAEVWAFSWDFQEMICIADNIHYIHQLQNLFTTLNNGSELTFDVS